MRITELNKVTKNLQRDCSKYLLKEALDTYNIIGVKETVNPNIVVLESEDNEEFNIACSNNDSFYLLHGIYGDFSSITKLEIKEEPSINIDHNGYKEYYSTKMNITGYEDQLRGIVFREEKYSENIELKENFNNCSMVMRKAKHDKYVLPHEIVNEKLNSLNIHMYDYNNWSDPVMEKWYIENFVNYFTNNNLNIKIKSLLTEKNKVLTK